MRSGVQFAHLLLLHHAQLLARGSVEACTLELGWLAR